MLMDRIFQAVAAKRNPSILGLDTRLEYLPAEMQDQWDAQAPLDSAAALIQAFNYALIDASADIIPCVKIQSAYYEMYGVQGVNALKNTVDYAKNAGLFVIVDAKRNDIGSTADAYSDAYLGETTLPNTTSAAFGADMLTVNGYLGTDGIEPFLRNCKERDKGIFVLVKTSNPSSGQLQDRLLDDGKTVYEAMAELVETWGEGTAGDYGYASVGAVVGATYPEQGAKLREAHAHMPFLVPGYGAQGATGADLSLCFDHKGFGALINASRSLLCAHQKAPGLPYAQATRQEALRMQADILAAFSEAGRLAY